MPTRFDEHTLEWAARVSPQRAISGADKCDVCGGKNPPWFADNEVWDAVTASDPRGRRAVLCPACFIDRAKAVGYDTCWILSPIDPPST